MPEEILLVPKTIHDLDARSAREKQAWACDPLQQAGSNSESSCRRLEFRNWHSPSTLPTLLDSGNTYYTNNHRKGTCT